MTNFKWNHSKNFLFSQTFIFLQIFFPHVETNERWQHRSRPCRCWRNSCGLPAYVSITEMFEMIDWNKSLSRFSSFLVTLNELSVFNYEEWRRNGNRKNRWKILQLDDDDGKPYNQQHLLFLLENNGCFSFLY